MLRRSILYLFSVFLLATTVIAKGENKLDSLHHLIETTTIDSVKIKALDALSWKLMFRNPDTVLIIGKAALTLSEKLNNPNRIFDALNSIATANAVLGRYPPALVYFNRARKLAIRENLSENIIKVLNNIGLVYWYQGKLDSAISVYHKALDQYKTRKVLKSNMANIYNNLGLIYKNKGNINQAIKNYQEALAIFDSLGKVNREVANVINNLGIAFYEKGDLPNAMQYYLKALKIYESIDDQSNSYSNTLSNIGNIYKEQKEYNKALDYFNRAIKVQEKVSSQSNALATTLNNIGDIYMLKKEYPKAIDFTKRALEMQEAMGENTNGMSASLSNLGNLMLLTNQVEEATNYFEKAFDIQVEIGDKRGVATSLYNLGNIDLRRKKLKQAVKKCKESYTIAKDLDLLKEQKNACDCLFDTYKRMGNYQKAFQYLKLFVNYTDSLSNDESAKEITQQAMQYEFDKIQYQDSLKRAEKSKREELERREEDLKKEAAIQRQKIYTVSGGVGFILMLGLAFVLFRGYQNKQKANDIISGQKEEVERQKAAVEQQNIIIEGKNQEIVDSINYAKRIQNIILPSTSELAACLEENFVLFRPKDIVSGDFYWADKFGEDSFFSVIDCTGHGVPGALVSVVANNGLNRVLNEFKITQPAAILDRLNLIVEESFTTSTENIRDGMDMAICKLNRNKMELEYAGANNPIYIIRHSLEIDKELSELANQTLSGKESTLYEIKGDKQPIGKYEYRHDFNNHKLKVQKGDCIYVFSDGFADQFGGPKGKKFMYRPFKRLLVNANQKPMEEQGQLMEQTFDQWKKEVDQIDDVCVMGIRV